MTSRVQAPLTVVSLLLLTGATFAQSWIEYVSRTDFFSITFPAEPTISDTMYETQYGITLPARVYYNYDDARRRYSVTVVNYTDAKRIHTERATKCREAGGDGDSCDNFGGADVAYSMDYAAFHILQRSAKIVELSGHDLDLVLGRRLHVLNADGSQTFAIIMLHELRLYIVEATVPAGTPPPALFTSSLLFLDNEGKRIRYATPYAFGFPIPPRTDKY